MNFIHTKIENVFLIVPCVVDDDRGFFMETWQAGKFADVGIDVDFVQDNHCKSIQGTSWGLHYHIRQPQVSWVFDVAVD